MVAKGAVVALMAVKVTTVAAQEVVGMVVAVEGLHYSYSFPLDTVCTVPRRVRCCDCRGDTQCGYGRYTHSQSDRAGIHRPQGTPHGLAHYGMASLAA